MHNLHYLLGVMKDVRLALEEDRFDELRRELRQG
jgi:queuine/archaeosine tRNA-ribosyltransferase